MTESRDIETGCPPVTVWDQIATGFMTGPEAEQLLEHAARCDDCAAALRGAIAVFAPVPEPVPSRKSNRRWWSIAIAAGVAATAMGLWWRIDRPDSSVAAAYVRNRTIEMRVVGAGHGSLLAARSATGARSRELAEAALEIARKLERNPSDLRALQEKGRLALLEWRTSDAIAALAAAGSEARSDLASAYYQRAQQGGGRADLERSRELLDVVLTEEPSSTVALFNRAIVRKALGLDREAADDLKKAAAIEKDEGWRRETIAKLREWRR